MEASSDMEESRVLRLGRKSAANDFHQEMSTLATSHVDFTLDSPRDLTPWPEIASGVGACQVGQGGGVARMPAQSMDVEYGPSPPEVPGGGF